MSDSSGTNPVDIRNDVTDLSFATPRGIQDTTGHRQERSRAPPAAGRLQHQPERRFQLRPSRHAVFKTVPSTSVNRPVAITVNGTNLSANCLFSGLCADSRGGGGAYVEYQGRFGGWQCACLELASKCHTSHVVLSHANG